MSNQNQTSDQQVTTPAHLADKGFVDLEEHFRSCLQRRLEKVSAKLRGLADQVDQRGKRIAELDRPAATYVVTEVVHDVMWGFAHLGADEALHAAANFDQHMWRCDNAEIATGPA